MGLPERVVHGGLVDKGTLKLESQKFKKIKIRKYTQTFKTIICSVEKEYCWVFQLPDLISGPLDGVLYNRRERLESAEWDLLFWGVPLGGRRKAILGW